MSRNTFFYKIFFPVERIFIPKIGKFCKSESIIVFCNIVFSEFPKDIPTIKIVFCRREICTEFLAVLLSFRLGDNLLFQIILRKQSLSFLSFIIFSQIYEILWMSKYSLSLLCISRSKCEFSMVELKRKIGSSERKKREEEK